MWKPRSGAGCSKVTIALPATPPATGAPVGTASRWSRRRLGGLALALAMLHGTALADASELAQPSPGLDAGDVIATVIDALAEPDQPYEGAGIEQTWQFASPPNRQQTGPLERFRKMVQNERYAPLLGHRSADRGRLRKSGDQAYQEVTVIGADGNRVTYAFQLSRYSTEACDNCWFTDAVIPVERDDMDAI